MARDGIECLQEYKENEVNAILLDIQMPKKNGLQVLDELKKTGCNVPIIMVTANNQIETAVKAIKAGAYEYLTKPVDFERLSTVLRNALQLNTLKDEVTILKSKIRVNELFDGIIGKSAQLEEIFKMTKKVLSTKVNVLIIGESGTGKELLARAIHYGSNRNEKPFVPVNCAAISHELADSLLFGHKKGSFTGATDDRVGYFEQAHEGTIFLDEVGDMNLEIQAKILRVLEEKTVRRVGEDKERTLDFRIIAATNKDFSQTIADDTYRSDLYYRLEEYPIYLPPLRERKDDIPLLANHFLHEFCEENDFPDMTFTDDVITEMVNHPWYANIRELKNVVRRATIRAKDNLIINIELSNIINTTAQKDETGSNEINQETNPNKDVSLLATTEKQAIENAFQKTNRDTQQAAKMLGISRATIYRKLKKYGID